MPWEYLFSFFYFFLAFWVVNKWQFFKRSGLNSVEINALFFLKISFAFLAAVYLKNSNHLDYLNFNQEGDAQYQILKNSPSSFFSDWGEDIKNYGWGGLMNSSHSFWANIRFGLIYKFIAVINMITNGNFYMNSLIFSSFVFAGNVCFFKIFNSIYTNQKRKIIFTTFLVPSMLLYTSCIHKDGLVFIALSIICYHLFSILNKTAVLNLKNFFLLLFAFCLLFLLRNYVFVVALVSLLISLSYHYFEKRKRWILIGFYSFMVIAFFVPFYHGHSFAQSLISRKEDFSNISHGNTNINLNELKPTIQSFVINAPQAINHSFLRPYLFEFKSLSVNLAAIEVVFYELLLLIFIVFRIKKKETLHSINVFGLILLFHLMLIIGYTVPNIGAIVRYRSFLWIFLITPIVCNIDFTRVFSVFKKIKS